MYMLFFANHSGFIHDVSFVDNLSDDVQITPMNNQGTQDTSDDIPISSITDFVADITALFSAYSASNDGYEFRTSTNTYQHGGGETDHVEIYKIMQVPCTSRLNSDGNVDMTIKDIAKIKIEYCTYPHHDYTDDVCITLKFDTDKEHFSRVWDRISTSEKFRIKSYNALHRCLFALAD
jgi:hypothetical protein